MSNSVNLAENINLSLTEKKISSLFILKNSYNSRQNRGVRVVKLEPNTKLSANSSIDFAINDTFIKKIMIFKNKMKSKKKIM